MIDSTGQSSILHKSFIVVVFSGLFFRSLSIVELDKGYLFMSEYVELFDPRSVSQNGSYEIIKSPAKIIL